MVFHKQLFGSNNILLNANSEDVVVADYLPGDPSAYPTNITIVVYPGVTVGGTVNPSIDGRNLHPESLVTLINKGDIFGYGGKGQGSFGGISAYLYIYEPFVTAVYGYLGAYGAPGGGGQGYNNAPVNAGSGHTLPNYGVYAIAAEPDGNAGDESGPGAGKNPVSNTFHSVITPPLSAGNTTGDTSPAQDGGDAIAMSCDWRIVNEGNIYGGGGGGAHGYYYNTINNPSWWWPRYFPPITYSRPPTPYILANGASGAGGIWGADGDPGFESSPHMGTGSGGNALRLNGFSVSWVSGNNPTQVKGAVS